MGGGGKQDLFPALVCFLTRSGRHSSYIWIKCYVLQWDGMGAYQRNRERPVSCKCCWQRGLRQSSHANVFESRSCHLASFAVQNGGRDLTLQGICAWWRRETGVIVTKSVSFPLVNATCARIWWPAYPENVPENVIYKCTPPRSKFDKLDIVLHFGSEVLR